MILHIRSDACEQAAKEAKLRAEKAEEEVAELMKKSTQLEVKPLIIWFCDLFHFQQLLEA